MKCDKCIACAGGGYNGDGAWDYGSEYCKIFGDFDNIPDELYLDGEIGGSIGCKLKYQTIKSRVRKITKAEEDLCRNRITINEYNKLLQSIYIIREHKKC